jgi:hypothetical protein
MTDDTPDCGNCAALRAERDALRADLLSIHGSQDAALPGWAWVPKDRIYAKWTDRGDPLVQVKADFTPPYECDGKPQGNGFRWTSVGVDNHWIGYGWSASPAQAMRDADAAIRKPKPSRARHAR